MTEFSNNVMSLDELPNHEQVPLNPISSKYLVSGILQLIILTLVLSIAWGYFYYTSETVILASTLGIIAAIALALRFFVILKRQKKYGYAIRERDLIFKRGVIIEKTTVVPFVRIQHVSVSRNFIEKLLGLAKLKVFTAGGSGSDLSIPGLTPALAEKLKQSIVNQVKDESGK